MHAVDAPCPPVIFELLQLRLDIRQRIGVEQVAQLGFAQQLAQLRLIDRQRLCAAFRERGIAIVEIVRDVAKEE